MEIVLLGIAIWIIYKIVESWKNNQPENVLDNLESSVMGAEDALKNAVDKKKKLFEESWEHDRKLKLTTESELKKKINERLREIDDIQSLSKKIALLVTHLREKYVNNLQQQISILNDYRNWLHNKETIHSFYEHLDYIDDVESLQQENDECVIKCDTIQSRLISLSDTKIVKKLKL